MSHQLCESHWFGIDVSRDYPDIYDQSQHVHTRYRNHSDGIETLIQDLKGANDS